MRFCSRVLRTGVLAAILLAAFPAPGGAAQASPQVPDAATVQQNTHPPAGGEANLILPDLGAVDFQGINGRTLLMGGLLVCGLGLAFGLVIYRRLKNLPVHRSMLEISELIYETCKTYLITQGKFILLLELFIGTIMVLYFGLLQHFAPIKVAIILFFSLIGIGGSYGVAWFGIRVNTFANSRAAFAGLRGLPYPIHAIPLSAGMSIGMLLISVELFMMLCILLFIPGDEQQDAQHHEELDADEQHADAHAGAERNRMNGIWQPAQSGKRGAGICEGVHANPEPGDAVAARNANQAEDQDDGDFERREMLQRTEVEDHDDADEQLEKQDELTLRDQVCLARLINELRDLEHGPVHRQVLELRVDDEAEHQAQQADP